MGKVYGIKSTQMTIGRPKPKEINLYLQESIGE